MKPRNIHLLRGNSWLLILAVILLGIAPLLFIKNSEFGGADSKAQTAIQEINPDYEPWVQPLISPPGKETESLLFALQAALGAGTIGYVIGLYQGRNTKKMKDKTLNN